MMTWPRIDWGTLSSKYGLLLVWALVAAGFCVFGPATFRTWSNVQTILGTQSVILVLALGLCIALNAGEVDLSITGTMSVSVVLVGHLNVVKGWPIGLTVPVVLLLGLAIGAVIALFVVGIGIDSMIVTLGAGTLLSGVAVAINQQTVFNISPDLVSAMRDQFLGLQLSFWYGVVLVAVLWFVLKFTPAGIHLRFVGSNRDASRLTGIAVDRLRVASLMACSGFSALAGVVIAGTLGSTSPTVSSPYLLPAFAAAFLGSTTIQPGRFNAVGTFAAVYFLTTGITGIQLMGASGWVSNVFYGAAVMLAVAASTVAGKMRRRRDVRDNTPQVDNTPQAGGATGLEPGTGPNPGSGTAEQVTTAPQHSPSTGPAPARSGLHSD
ncbi:ABC transporter permease [Streptomyces sp. NPDC002928]|uniref:ABC transporter permease n=1 Tax=Streptomyces sp. NPDC002928 TaxID=3154440 RepID=UPI0033B627C0